MISKSFALTAGLAIAGFASAAAPASAQYFGVDTSAQTMGYTGVYNDNSGVLANATFASSAADPAGVTLSSPSYGTAYADVASSAQAEPASLHATADAHTHSITAKTFSGSAPYGFGYAHFYDRLTVKSDVLPAGTPVTIVFGNEVTLNKWTHTGVYDGYIEMVLQIGAGSGTSRWSDHYLYGTKVAEAPQIRVQTTVGSRLSVDGKLRTMAKAFYWDYNVGFGGDIHADATARVVVVDLPAGVTLESASGIAYPYAPVN